MTDPTPTVTRNEDASRYEIHVGDKLAGFAEYKTRPDGRILFTHTETEKEFRGQGLADVLASEALSDAAREGATIVPLCPFIAKYLSENEVAGAVIDWPRSSQAQDSASPGESPA
ncbi:GNAT family N-acetyltransferase [Microbacterium sp. NPDC078428]|uniref:GNAT family N-acetyltransferase n=1 Tax=Microbacterium sp. NPDC078428 TaxID=3364190 RepID=UPI0037C8C539